jgi:predicted P-loop ATPase
MSELAAMSGNREVEHIKAFISSQVDVYRPSYAPKETFRPRRCVIAGTTNRSDYLKDDTGNRRFLPVRCGEIDLNALRCDRDQLWAEVLARYRRGEPWWIVDADAIACAKEEQSARLEDHAWEPTVAAYLEGRSSVTLRQVGTALGFPQDMDIKQPDERRIAAVLRRLGWRRGLKREGTEVVRRWMPA